MKESILQKVQSLCQHPIQTNAQEQMNELRKQVPEKDLSEYDRYYEALFVAQEYEKAWGDEK